MLKNWVFPVVNIRAFRFCSHFSPCLAVDFVWFVTCLPNGNFFGSFTNWPYTFLDHFSLIISRFCFIFSSWKRLNENTVLFWQWLDHLAVPKHKKAKTEVDLQWCMSYFGRLEAPILLKSKLSQLFQCLIANQITMSSYLLADRPQFPNLKVLTQDVQLNSRPLREAFLGVYLSFGVQQVLKCLHE